MVEHAAGRASSIRRVAIVGASHGVGATCAREFAERGAVVAIADIDRLPLRRLAAQIGAHAFSCDILSERSVSDLVAQMTARIGQVQLLINAAGTGYVRTVGMMRVSREFARATGGHPALIVNIAGRPEREGTPSTHAGSEIAFTRLSQGIGETLKDTNVRVLTLSRVEDDAAAVDLVGQLWQSIPGMTDRPDGERSAATG